MGLFNLVRNAWRYSDMSEEMKQFAKMGDDVSTKELAKVSGEGYEHVEHPYSSLSMSSFNMFYSSYINKTFKSELEKIMGYRNIAEMPEIADVIEDIVIESSQEDLDGHLVHLDVMDEELEKSKNTVENLENEFDDLFNKKIKISQIIADLLRTYYIDGRVYYERLINKEKKEEGIVGIKKLPTETMDFEYDPKTLKITRFFQYLSAKAKRPKPGEPVDDNTIAFNPEQIGFIDYGIYGRNRYDIIGYLDKAKIPYNQLKLLETSVIIYRLVRAPERFVFKIDVGQMPRDKAIKYVEEIKNRMIKRPTYDPSTGTLGNSPEIFSILDNFFIPTCLTMDTEILTLAGNKTLGRIVHEFEAGIDNYVVVFNKKDPKSTLGCRIKWAGITRKNTDLVQVSLSNGEIVRPTPDHRFVLPDGSEVEAQNLEPGQELASHVTNGSIKVVEVKELAYKEDTGCLEVENENHNFLLACGIFVANSSDGRGADVTTVGGNPSGFAELGDINYFQRKLYKALKYPMSRVAAKETGQEGAILFSNSPMGEISRDEIKWATFLERHQTRFCNEFEKLFLLHLEFKGMKKEYDLDISKIGITLNPPSFYKDKQAQLVLEARFANYLALSQQTEFAKVFLMEKYLELSEEDIQKNSEYLKKDIKLGFKEDPMEVVKREALANGVPPPAAEKPVPIEAE